MGKGKRIFIKIFIPVIVIILLVISYIYISFPRKYKEYVEKYSIQYKLDSNMVYSVIKSESRFKVNAKSHKDANGLMQITTSTGEWIAKQLNISDFNTDMLYDPETNIKFGCWYLDNLRTQFNGNIDLVIAAYNAGSGNVEKWLADQKYSLNGKNLNYIPFPETDRYVKKVNTSWRIYSKLYK